MIVERDAHAYYVRNARSGYGRGGGSISEKKKKEEKSIMKQQQKGSNEVYG